MPYMQLFSFLLSAMILVHFCNKDTLVYFRRNFRILRVVSVNIASITGIYAEKDIPCVL